MMRHASISWDWRLSSDAMDLTDTSILVACHTATTDPISVTATKIENTA